MKQTRGKCHCFASLLLTVSGRSFWNKWMYFVGLFVPCFWCKTHRRKQMIISLRKRCVCPSWGWSRLHVSFAMSTLTACFSNVRVVEFELKAWFYWHIGGIQPHKKRGRHSTDIQSRICLIQSALAGDRTLTQVGIAESLPETLATTIHNHNVFRLLQPHA